MRPFCAACAADACAQKGERSKLPDAPRTRLPKPARRRSRRAMPPRRDERRMLKASKWVCANLPMTQCSTKLVLRGAHDQMRHEPQRAIEISRRKREVVGTELALEQINQDPPDLRVDRHPQEAHEQVIDRLAGSPGTGAKHHGG